MAFITASFTVSTPRLSATTSSSWTSSGRSFILHHQQRQRRAFIPIPPPSSTFVKTNPNMSMEEGSDLIDFSLPTNGGGTLTADDIKTGPTILYFYPRDATPGCTTEAKDFRDMKEDLDGVGATVVGVSKDSVESHDKFVSKHELPFALISDDGTLCEGFGVWKMKNSMGNKKMGIERSTFVIKDGKVVKEWRKVKSTGHAAIVVDYLKEM